MTEERERAAAFSFAIVIGGTVLGLIVTLIVLNSITGPLRRMVGAINSIARGDYETEIPNAGRDEIGDIAESLRVFRDSLVERDRLAAEHLQSEARLVVSESRFTALIDNLPSAVLLKDTSGRFLVANRKWHEWFNPENADITGRTSEDHFPAHHAQVHSQESEILETGQPSTQEFEINLRDGSPLYTLLQKFPVMDREGRIIGIGGINTDLTPLKEAETALLRAKEEAELANRSKTVFLANMSHELRTPLNAIIGFSSVMREQTYGLLGDARYRDYAENINRSGEHLLQLISDILDISKIEAGAAEIVDAEIDIAEIFDECLTMIRGRADEKGLNLHVRVPDDFPRLRADQRQVKQIILNLLSNSVKFTPAYGRIEVNAGLSQRRRITLSISDTGIGIAKADLAKVLEPFGQIRTRAEHAKEGTGLGLALCKSLTELHGGNLVIESEPGRGTEAIVSFPAERTVPLDEATDETPVASVGAE